MKTIFLLLSIILHAASSSDTPSPSAVVGEGTFEVGSNGYGQTLSPTLQVILPGRGDEPTASPSVRPTIPPTSEDLGAIADVVLPEVNIPPANNEPKAEEEEEDSPPPTDAPTASPPADDGLAFAGAKSETNGSGATAATATGIISALLTVAVAAGAAVLL